MTARRFEDAPAVPRLCECGCGRITPISSHDHPERGYLKGEHARFVFGHGRRQKTVAKRLAEKLAPQDPASGCIEFTGYRDPRGYGQIGVGSRDDGDRRLIYAHRLAWELAGRTYPAGKTHLMHRCDNPACCNVDHLAPGDDADNLGDMAAKGRGRTGKMPFGVGRNHKRFFAKVSYRQRVYYLGTYDTPEEASAVAVERKEELRGAQKV